MNRKICESCRRYAKHENPDKWYCGKRVYQVSSHVIPGYAFWKRDELYTYHEGMMSPEWCEYAAEQMLAEPDDELDNIPEVERIFRWKRG